MQESTLISEISRRGAQNTKSKYLIKKLCELCVTYYKRLFGVHSMQKKPGAL
jgi:hypothetical protein